MENPSTPNPYAEFGGSVSSAPPPAVQDPYAEFGGNATAAAPQAQQTAPAPQQTAPQAAPQSGYDKTYTGQLWDKVKQMASDAAEGIEDNSIGTYQHGALKGARETGNTLNKLNPEHWIGMANPELGETYGPHGEIVSPDNTAQNFGEGAGKTIETVLEFVGGLDALKGLSAGEKMMKSAAVLKVLEKYPEIMETLSAGIKRFPRIAEAAVSGTQQGTVGAAQAALKGASPGQALMTGALTGAGGGAVELGLNKASDLIDAIKPTTTKIGKTEIPILASQKPGGSTIGRATLDDRPEKGAPTYGEAQQAGGQAVIQNVAQRATQRAIDLINESRQQLAAVTDPSRLLEASENPTPFKFTIEGPATEPERVPGKMALDARKKQIGTEVVAKPEGTFDPKSPSGGVVKNPLYQFLTSPKPGQEPIEAGLSAGNTMEISDPVHAQAALSQLNDLTDSVQFDKLPPEQQAHITASRDSLRDQLDLYHSHQAASPHFDPVDAQNAMSKVGSFGDAADQIEFGAKPVYQKLDAVSDGRFSVLRDERKAALKIMRNPSSTAAYDSAAQRVADSEAGIDEIFKMNPRDVSRPELENANAAWRDAKILDRIHAAVEGAFNGVPQGIADATGVARRLKGPTLNRRLGQMLQKIPQSEVERVIGADGLQNLFSVGGLLDTPQSAKAAVNLLRATSLHLVQRSSYGAVLGGALGGAVGHLMGGPATGAAVGSLAGGLGAASEDVTRLLLRRAAVDPRVGKMLSYAVTHNVSHSIAAPLIAATIQAVLPTDNSEPAAEPAQEPKP